jgi:hypothetical protein
MPAQTTTERDVEAEWAAGLWVPSYHGNWFTVANKGGRMHAPWGHTQTDTSVKYATLAEAQAECGRRNEHRGGL